MTRSRADFAMVRYVKLIITFYVPGEEGYLSVVEIGSPLSNM